jgi:prepilin-type N-terminal cleavage/methylation domain-containing protein
MKKRGSGFSLVELIVAIGILVVLSTFFVMAMRWNRNALDNVAKTDLTAKLRNTSLILSRMLTFSTEILFPAGVSTDYVNQIIFRNSENEVMAIYVSEENQLCLYNYSTREGREITPCTISLKARIAQENLLEVIIRIKKDKFEFAITNRFSTCNTLP